MVTPDDDLKKKLEKIRKKLMESEELSAEASRRFQVANEKLAGYLIESIESQRGKLKETKKIGFLLGILLRISDLRNNVFIEILQEQEHKNVPRLGLITKMKETYEEITNDLSDFVKEDAKSPILPSLSSKPLYPIDALLELNLCLGQVEGLVLGRLYEFL